MVHASPYGFVDDPEIALVESFRKGSPHQFTVLLCRHPNASSCDYVISSEVHSD
jgi:hypothetical protein